MFSSTGVNPLQHIVVSLVPMWSVSRQCIAMHYLRDSRKSLLLAHWRSNFLRLPFATRWAHVSLFSRTALYNAQLTGNLNSQNRIFSLECLKSCLPLRRLTPAAKSLVSHLKVKTARMKHLIARRERNWRQPKDANQNLFFNTPNSFWSTLASTPLATLQQVYSKRCILNFEVNNLWRSRST